MIRMVFFDSCGPDGFLPLADIVRIERGWTSRDGEHHPSIVFMKGGKKVHVDDSTVDQILNSTRPIIAAIPGFLLLTYNYFPGTDDPGPWIDRETIIAWRDGQYGGLDPVLLTRWFDKMGEMHAVLEPTGAVQTQDRYYDDEEEWARSRRELIDLIHFQKMTDERGTVQ